MKNLVLIFLSLCSLAFFSGRGLAATISLTPTTQDMSIGSTASVDLNISGLGNFTDPSLGAFFTEITFDDSILSFDSVTYGSFLGDTDPSSFETDIVTIVGPGFVSLDEFSFLFDFELDALQPDNFTLATLSFTATTTGSSLLEFGAMDLSDAIGLSILDPTLETAGITVKSVPPVTVPEPGILMLFLSGVLVLSAFKMEMRSS